MTSSSRQDGRATRYLLIESHAPNGAAGGGFCRDARVQAELGRPVVLFLIQDGVTLVLPDHAPALKEFLTAGGELWVDRFSLAQRGLEGLELPAGARAVDMGTVAQAVLDPAVKVVWH